MPKPESDPKKDAQFKELFAQAALLFDSAIHFAFLHCRHQPSLEDEARMKQRLSLHLMEDNYRRLRGYDYRAKLETWLQVIANHEASYFLQRESKYASFDDVPAEMFRQAPTQEILLLEKEQWHLVEKVLPKLTARQRKIFDDWRQGVAAERTAQEMDTKVATVYRKRQVVLEKIRKLIQKAQK